MVAIELLKLAMETEEGRKERLKKMVANHSAEVGDTNLAQKNWRQNFLF